LSQVTLSQVPVPHDGIELAELEGEGVLYCHEKLSMIYMNESASAIWRLCDGHRSVAEIISALAEAFPDTAADISIDVRETLGLLVSEGVLELVGE